MTITIKSGEKLNVYYVDYAVTFFWDDKEEVLEST